MRLATLLLLSITNHAGISPHYLHRLEPALVAQVAQVEHYWRIDPGPYSIMLESRRAVSTKCYNPANSLTPTGCHVGHQAWVWACRGCQFTSDVSHELDEMSTGYQIGDYDFSFYQLDGFTMQDFMLPGFHHDFLGYD
jgi:hypothetical protein